MARQAQFLQAALEHPSRQEDKFILETLGISLVSRDSFLLPKLSPWQQHAQRSV